MFKTLTAAVESLPAIIEAASKDVLGVACLIVISLGVIAVIYFNKAPVWARLTVFALILSAALGFLGTGIMRTAGSGPEIEFAAPCDLQAGQFPIRIHRNGYRGPLKVTIEFENPGDPATAPKVYGPLSYPADSEDATGTLVTNAGFSDAQAGLTGYHIVVDVGHQTKLTRRLSDCRY